MIECDVLVMGGGPGGVSAALLCAEAGLRVRLIEGAAFPREVPGETLPPGVESLLRRLGVWEPFSASGFLRHEGNWVQWDRLDPAPRFQPFGRDREGPWSGFQAWRATLDTLMLDRARAAGVDVRQPCQAVRLRLAQGRLAGVLTSDGPVSARFLVDATGRRHWLAHRLGLTFERFSPRLVARYGYVTGDCPGRVAEPVLVADSDGWTWTARVRDGLYQWTRLVLRGSRPPQDWLPEEFRSLTRCGPPRGADVSWRMASPTAGPGYFLVGDAASVLDPASSHGVLRAIMSGMMAGHLIARVIRREATEPEAAVAYDDWLRRGFLADVSALVALYRQLPMPPEWVVSPSHLFGR